MLRLSSCSRLPSKRCNASLRRIQPSVAPNAREQFGIRRSFANTTSNVMNIDSSFLSPTSGGYIDEMYALWLEDPASVHRSWDVYFRTGQYQAPPTLVPDYGQAPGIPKPAKGEKAPKTAPSSPVHIGSVVSPVVAAAQAAASYATHGVVEIASSYRQSPNAVDPARVVQMVRAFQVRGHLLANLDPLGLAAPRINPDDLRIESFGFSEQDLDKDVELGGLVTTIKGFLDSSRGSIKLRHLYTRLRETYCGSIGYEYMHIPQVEKCNWLREKIETLKQRQWTRDDKVRVLTRLTWADHFERFLAKKFASAKRFGLEGAETLIPGMKALIDTAAELGASNVVVGMPHRGRLNVLSTVVRKPMEHILCEFEGAVDIEGIGAGDVKYHLGMSYDRVTANGKHIHLSLLANPSHLEAVNPVVCGKTRAKQLLIKDEHQAKVMAVLIHGDAAFSGQGIVYETMNMSGLRGYSVGGTVHIVVNNQVGFTTDPTDSRSTTYCTDLAKAYDAPIFHVNADDPEAVVEVFQLAAEYRAQFQKDVVIDLFGYRKHGHNEIDEPQFTQPLMYKQIKEHRSTLHLYQAKLKAENGLDKEISDISHKVDKALESAWEKSKTYKAKVSDWLGEGSNWSGLKACNTYSKPQSTGVDLDILKDIGTKVSTYPADFVPHKRLQSVLDKKLETIKSGKHIDWATGEALAFGSLLLEGKHVRLSGQDVERGTFSHRHAVLHDQTTRRKHCALATLSPNQAPLSIYNSLLSEFAVLGFEYGYSLENPNQLVLWEAQFGDFVNGAQIIIDQFLSSGEDKWYRQSGLVMLLPHGYEGQGPEHSSARLERFLQSSNDNPDVIPDNEKSFQIQQSNWQVCNMTTPANYFHVLRRQLYRDFRKPLIIMSPKSLLRNPAAVSTFEDMAPGTSFQPVISESSKLVEGSKVARHILCSGKVYYDLLNARNSGKINNVAITRVEQIAPFPFHQVAAEASRFPNAEVVWCQEEPMNMGSWFYTKPRIESALRQINSRPVTVKYVGRAPSASTAAGLHSTHEHELKKFLTEAFAL